MTPEGTNAHLDRIRHCELQIVLDELHPRIAGRDLLEIGSGSRAQLLELKNVCRSVTGVEVSEQPGLEEMAADMHLYDGTHLPFADKSFDVVYSSNVLEHVLQPEALAVEMRRVLRDGGIAVHVLPSHTWRFWTMLAHYFALPKTIRQSLARHREPLSAAASSETASRGIRWLLRAALALAVAPRHGESGNRFSEFFLFRPAAWTRLFERQGWGIEQVSPVRLFYTGNALFGDRLDMGRRRELARWLGASTWMYVLRPKRSS
jgi:SAM-dependent methyltransferase